VSQLLYNFICNNLETSCRFTCYRRLYHGCNVLQTYHDEGENKENELNESDQVKNPSVSRRKGRPETKRYKSANEKKPRAKYTCGTCGQSGHNSARCQQNQR